MNEFHKVFIIYYLGKAFKITGMYSCIPHNLKCMENIVDFKRFGKKLYPIPRT